MSNRERNSKPTWDELSSQGMSARDASMTMHCSRRTALKSLQAAASRAQTRFEVGKAAESVARQTIGMSGQQSNWPRSFVEMAERIAKECDGVGDSDRRRMLEHLPRGVEVAR